MNEPIHIVTYKSPIGDLLLGVYKDKLCICDWKYRKMRAAIDKRVQKYFQSTFIYRSHPVIDEAIEQLEDYFNKKRIQFDIPLALAGTDFQQSVWNKLIEIPFGTTKSYLELSKDLQNEKAIRAVASANGANAISIIIPCHRIIGADGSLVGYAGGLNAKKKLLLLEDAFDTPLDLFSGLE